MYFSMLIIYYIYGKVGCATAPCIQYSAGRMHVQYHEEA